MVHLKGTIALGADTIPFTLPAGYRPAKARVFRIPVQPTGTITSLIVYDEFVQLIQSGYSGNEIYSLDGVSFRAAE